MAGRLKLLLLTHNYPRYQGDFSGVFLSLLARRLVEQGHEVHVLAPHDAGVPEEETRDGVQIHRFRYAADEVNETLAYRGNMHEVALGSFKGIMLLRRFLKAFQARARTLIETESFDCLAGHWLVPTGIVMKRLRRKFKGPMVLSSHGSDLRVISKYGRLPYRYLRPLCGNLCRWTVVSSWLRSQALLIDPALDPLIEVLPLPHDESMFYPDESVTRDRLLVAAVTRFTKQKRVRNLIKAFARVTTSVTSARLEIYGSGPLKKEVEKEIAAQGLRGQVRMFDPVSQEKLREVYNRASIVVLNSHHEGFGLALSEAMLCGAAVVGTRSGGIVDIIEHQKRGLLVELDAVDNLSQAIVSLLTDADYRDRLAKAGLEFARSHYASGPLAERYANILQECVTNHGRP